MKTPVDERPEARQTGIVLAAKIEREALEKGFRLALLGVRVDRGSNAVECRAVMFNGGAAETAFTYKGRWFDPPASLARDFRRFLAPVMAPPGFVAAYGGGWQDLVAQTVPLPYSNALVAIDLLRTAACLKGVLKRPDIHLLMELYGITSGADTESLDSPLYEALLWGSIAAADGEGLDWPEFFSAVEMRRPRVSFEHYAFSQETLNNVPAAPGVYTMFDREGAVLYVGKSANLRNRVSGYFRPAVEAPQKISAIRERIHHFDCRIVGSELEALLVEQNLIANHRPPVNVQRKVAEGASRYVFPFAPVAVFCPSTEKDRFEVFCLGEGGRCVQCRVSVRRPVVKQLAKCAAYVAGGPAEAPDGKAIRAWDGAGAELACRYFSRFRDRLVWMELPASEDDRFLASLRKAIAAVAGNPSEAAEFRLTADEDGE